MLKILSLLICLSTVMTDNTHPDFGCFPDWGRDKYETMVYEGQCVRLVWIETFADCLDSEKDAIKCLYGYCKKHFNGGTLYRSRNWKAFAEALDKAYPDVAVVTGPIVDLMYEKEFQYINVLYQNNRRIVQLNKGSSVAPEVFKEACVPSDYKYRRGHKIALCNHIKYDRQKKDVNCTMAPCPSWGAKYFLCMHPKSPKCKSVNMKTPCMYDWSRKKCYSRNIYRPPNDRNNTDCTFPELTPIDECKCECDRPPSAWTTWSATCGRGTRSRHRGKYLTFSKAPKEVICTGEQKSEICCYEEQNRLLPACNTFLKGTQISLSQIPCSKDGGDMKASGGSHYCECRNGFSGILCEEDPSQCSEDTCNGKGTCVPGMFGAYCICNPNVYGKYCTESGTAWEPGEGKGGLSDNMIIVIGCAVGGVALVTILAIVVLKQKQKRRRGTRGYRDPQSSSMESSRASTADDDRKRKKTKKSPWENYIQGKRGSKR